MTSRETPGTNPPPGAATGAGLAKPAGSLRPDNLLAFSYLRRYLARPAGSYGPSTPAALPRLPVEVRLLSPSRPGLVCDLATGPDVPRQLVCALQPCPLVEARPG